MKWTDLPPTVVLAAADICDGHSIFAPKALLDVGVPQELVERYTQIFESNFNDPKQTIFDNKTGEPVKAMEGVYGLPVLLDMVTDFKLQCEHKFGRGFQARVYQEALHKHLDKNPVDA